MRLYQAALSAALLATISGGLAACGGRQNVETSDGTVALDETASIVVDNQGYLDMTIYVLEAGAVRRRIGIAAGGRKTQLVIPRALVGNGRDLQFLADPIGSTSTSVSRRIFVAPGDRVGLTILP